MIYKCSECGQQGHNKRSCGKIFVVKNKKEDPHHAQKNGMKFEKMVVKWIKNYGFDVLKTIKDFEIFYGEHIGRKMWQKHFIIRAPADFKEDGFDTFEPDGFIPQLNCYVEVKGADAVGTADEKAGAFLDKILGGVYKDKLLIVGFVGLGIIKSKWWKRFQKNVKNIENVIVLNQEKEIKNFFSLQNISKVA